MSIKLKEMYYELKRDGLIADGSYTNKNLKPYDIKRLQEFEKEVNSISSKVEDIDEQLNEIRDKISDIEDTILKTHFNGEDK